jgi:Plant invertase/pectin methylesterase inhibitor
MKEGTNKMAKKVVVGVLASLLVIIVCAEGLSTKKARSDPAPSIQTTTKAIRYGSRNSLCANALNKESCELMLTQLSPKSTSSRDGRFEASLAQASSAQTEIFRGFVEATLKELEIAVELSAGVASGKVARNIAVAKLDCNMLLNNSLQYLKEAVALVKDKNIEDLRAEADNIIRKLTSCMTFMYTCVDGFEMNPKINSEMNRILENATLTSSNAMTVINKFSPSIAQPKSFQGTSRNLIGYPMDQQGYPEWLSTGDRKLLEDIRYFQQDFIFFCLFYI